MKKTPKSTGPYVLTDPSLLQATLQGLQLQQQRVTQQIQYVRSLLGKAGAKPSGGTTSEPATPAPRKRQLSEESRQRIAAAQQKRWAKYRRERKGR